MSIKLLTILPKKREYVDEAALREANNAKLAEQAAAKGFKFNQGGDVPFIAGPMLTDPVYADSGAFISALTNLISGAGASDRSGKYKPLTKKEKALKAQKEFEKKNEAKGYAGGGWVTDAVLDRLREVESGGDNEAVSPAGAIGAYQWLPTSAKQAGYGVKPFDPKDEKAAREATRNIP